MASGFDEVVITILDDGSLKIETGKISGPNHAAFENALSEIAKLCGGVQTRTRKGASHVHQGQGQHVHAGPGHGEGGHSHD